MSMYQIVGADGRQYGPVSGEQLRQWIAEGRANAQTQAFGEGAAEWKPLGALPEFAGLFAPPVPPTIRPPVSGPRGTVRRDLGPAGARHCGPIWALHRLLVEFHARLEACSGWSQSSSFAPSWPGRP